jgi:hypothetical protein
MQAHWYTHAHWHCGHDSDYARKFQNYYRAELDHGRLPPLAQETVKKLDIVKTYKRNVSMYITLVIPGYSL